MSHISKRYAVSMLTFAIKLTKYVYPEYCAASTMYVTHNNAKINFGQISTSNLSLFQKSKSENQKEKIRSVHMTLGDYTTVTRDDSTLQTLCLFVYTFKELRDSCIYSKQL